MKKPPPKKRELLLHCCPLCGSKELKLAESDEDPDDLAPGEKKLLEPGETVGVVFDPDKTGCNDWAHLVVGVICINGHLFWVEPGDDNVKIVEA